MRLSDPSSGSCTPPALPPPRAVTCPPTRCGAPTGVIDWGDVCVGDPAIDLSIAFGALAGPARAAFLAAHGALDAATELRARAIALTLATTLLAYALDQRLPHVEAECRRALVAAVS